MQIAQSAVAKDLRPGASYWEVGEAIAQLAGECNRLLSVALKPENVVKNTFDSHRYIAMGRAC